MASTEDDDKMLTQHFNVEIKGLWDKVPNVVSCDAGRVSQEIVEATQGDKPEYRTYTYGSCKYEDLTLVLNTGPANKKIAKWVDKATKLGGKGDSLRRDISINLMSRDGSKILRSYHAKDCFPLSLNDGDQGTQSEIKSITLTCKVGYVEVS